MTLYYFINYYIKSEESFTNLILPKEKSINLKIKYPGKIHNIGLNKKETYLDSLFDVLKISTFPFPTNKVYTNGSLDNIQKLIDNKLDLAFIDEELLLAYINNDELLQNTLMNREKFKTINFSLIGVCYDTPLLFLTMNDTNVKTFSDIKNKKFEIKESKSTKKYNVNIGVLKGSADEYHLRKILINSNYKLGSDVEISLENDYETLKKKLLLNSNDKNRIHILFITDTKKNKIIFDLTENGDCIFISPIVKKDEIENQRNLKLINNYKNESFLVYKNEFKDSNSLFKTNNLFAVHENDEKEFDDLLKLNKAPKINKKLYSSYKNLINDFKMFRSKRKLKTKNYPNIVFLPIHKKENLQEISNRQKLFVELNASNDTFYNNVQLLSLTDKTFLISLQKRQLELINEIKNRNNLIIKNFYSIHNKKVNLNDFYNNINTSYSLDTYSTKLILVAKNDLFNKNIEKLTVNYIKNLDFLKKHINVFKNKKQFLNYTVNDAFIFKNLINVKEDIDIHNSSKPIYIKNNLLKTSTVYETNI